MEEQVKRPDLSDCLTRVRKELDGKEVSAAELTRTVCEQHDSTGGRSPYREILAALASADTAGQVRPFGEWLELLLGSCGETVKVLHTDLTLLLVARHSPEIAAVFANDQDSAEQASYADKADAGSEAAS